MLLDPVFDPIKPRPISCDHLHMRLGHFDLNLFIALDALLESRSITRASERLHIGVSATSSALGRLREHFGDEILVQVGRRMELTPLAQTLRAPVRDIIVRSQATVAAKSHFDPAREERRFVFNASDYATSVLLTPLAQRLESEAPGISIDVVSLGDSNLQQLDRGEVDIAIYPQRNASAAHPQEDLFEDTYTCMVWEGHELKGDSISFEEYIGARHVAAQFGDMRVPTFEHWYLATHHVARNVVVTASTFNALAFLVIGTQRIATLQARLARLYEKLLPLRLLRPPLDIPPLKLVMQWNGHKTQDAAHAWLRQRIKAVAAEIA